MTSDTIFAVIGPCFKNVIDRVTNKPKQRTSDELCFAPLRTRAADTSSVYRKSSSCSVSGWVIICSCQLIILQVAHMSHKVDEEWRVAAESFLRCLETKRSKSSTANLPFVDQIRADCVLQCLLHRHKIHVHALAASPLTVA